MDKEQLKFSGLSQEEVKKRVEEGKVNVASTVKTKSVGRIFRDNICTVFNLINVVLFILLLAVGSYKNTLFILVVLINTVIGIVQELRSKKSVDKLTILTQAKQKVIRSGEITELSKDELVLDDMIILSRGSQVPADCVVSDGVCQANESLLTGESDLIEKKEGDELLSGSFIAAGSVICRVVRVGSESYAAKLNNEAKYIKKNDSQIVKTFHFIINICSAIIVPLGVLMFVMRYLIHHMELSPAVVSTVGALVGLIPSGMVLLTSTVLAVSVIRLANKKILVNEMYCIETLARVDVLCLDKTGTLTAERMSVYDIYSFSEEQEKIKTALSSIVSASEDKNATLLAIGEYTKDIKPLGCESFIPFSSETKRSGGNFSDGRSYVIGAAEFVFPDKEKYKKVFEAIDCITETVRVLVLASSSQKLSRRELPSDLEPMALIFLKDELRDNVRETVSYFTEQGVVLKVISGDSVETVKRIALDCGIEGAEKAVDLSRVDSDEELKKAAENCNVFGRVTPAQKKKLILALKEKGHKVAMTGDGVNDVLALKEADCSVAMAAGSEAARNVSQLVLVHNDFAAMPDVVAEGRRTINNIERSSSLYLVKTIYSVILSVFFLFSAFAYPFQPIQLSLIGSLTVGFPSFVLALQPNKNIVRGNFTFNIIARAAPAALCVAANIILTSVLGGVFSISQEELSTIAVYVTSLIGLMLILRLCIPMNLLRGGMLFLCFAGLLVAFGFFRDLFALSPLGTSAIWMFIICAAVFCALFHLLYHFADRMIEKFKREPLKIGLNRK